MCFITWARVARARYVMEAGTTPGPTDAGIRPLHIAARFGHQSVVRLLVDRGADMNSATERQLLTPLLIAAACGQTSIVVRREGRKNIKIRKRKRGGRGGG